jgi:septal ring factor EnvC (AmiA/AmiB activator)
MRDMVCKIGVVIFICFFHVTLLAQSKEQLEKERAKIIREIESTSKILNSTKKTKELTMKEIKAASDIVDNRKKLAENIKVEITSADKTLKKINSEIDSLVKNYTILKSQYEKYLQRYYTFNLANNKLVYLLSSESLNAFLLRWRYIEQFKAFKNQKQAEVQTIRQELTDKLEKIDSIKATKSILLKEEESNLVKLERDKQKKDEVLKKISSREKELLAQLTEKQRQREKLNVAIEKVILEQIRLAEAAARKAAEAVAARAGQSKSGTKEDGVKVLASPTKEEVLSTEAKALSDNFAENKTKLPWPVSSGRISSRFGNQPHPTITGLTINNNGIDISSSKVQNVQCVFEGEVVSVNFIPGDIQYMIIIKHGKFFTVYSHLASASVGKGQKLKTGETIGQSSINDDGVSEVHFELWKDKVKQNPEAWLKSR